MKTMRLNQQRDSALLPGLSSSLLLSVSSLSCSAPLPLPLCDCLPSEVVVMAAIVEAVVLVSCTVEGPMVIVVGVLLVDREYLCVGSSVSMAPRSPARRSRAAEELRNFSIVSFELCCRVMGVGTFMWIRASHTSIHIFSPPTVLPPPPTQFTISPPLCTSTSLPVPPEYSHFM